MKRRYPETYVALFVVALLVCLLDNGCAKDPRLQLAQMNRAMEITEYKLIQAADAGKLSKGDVLLIDPLMQSARAVLDDSEARIAAGDTEAFRANERTFAAIIQRLTEKYLLPPTTQPAP